MAKKKKTNNDDQCEESVSFEDAAERLEQIVDRLEEGNLDLDESLSSYAEGIKLLKRCHSILQQAEKQVELLTSVDETGRTLTTPFDASASSMDDRNRTRS